MTDLFENAFHVLGATPRTTRAALVELAEHASLVGDPAAVAAAKSALSNPRTRLAAEVGWLLGLSPNKAKSLLAQVEQHPVVNVHTLGVPPQAAVNLLATALKRLRGIEFAYIEVGLACTAIADQFESLSVPDIQRALNEERQLAGLPQVEDKRAIEAEIESRRRYFVSQMMDALDSLPSDDMVNVATILVEKATEGGASVASTLIEDLADAYELRSHEYLSTQADRIKMMIDSAREAADAGKSATAINTLTDEIAAQVCHWDLVAQPVQLIKQSRGLVHDESVELAMAMRELAIHLFNKHDDLDIAKKLSEVLQRVFAEVPDVVERVEEDMITLDEISQKRQKAQINDKQAQLAFAREITYETSFGLLFKSNFRLSPNGIEWEGTRYSLESVNAISWGGVREQYRTTYSVFAWTSKGNLAMEFSDSTKYEAITDRLWRAVGPRLVQQFLDAMASGKEVRFGNMTLRDDGVLLPVARLFRTALPEFVPWASVRREVSDGSIELSATTGKARGSADLRTTPNAPVLAITTEIVRKKGCNKISSILG